MPARQSKQVVVAKIDKKKGKRMPVQQIKQFVVAKISKKKEKAYARTSK